MFQARAPEAFDTKEEQQMEICSPVFTFGTGSSRDIKWGIPARDDAFISVNCKCHVLMALIGEHDDKPGLYYAGWAFVEREGEELIFKEGDSATYRPEFERTYSTIEDALRAARLDATTSMVNVRNDLHGGPPDRGGSSNRRARRTARHRRT
jgi:hypothetical protein